MYDSNGDIMYTYGSQENGTRKNVTYDDLPQVLVDAIVAAEDSRFFEHNGFDLPRIVKAALSNLKAGGITGGGSTITQQLIKKTYFPDAQKTYSRKLSEIILAIQADKALSKEEILTLYLNKIYFGRSTRSIGISSASRYYFNKDVSELTLPEAAMLAGHRKLDNLTVIVDNNGLQIDGNIEDVCSPYPIDKKFEAFNFHVINVEDGNDFDQLKAAFDEAKTVKGMPTAIIMKTVKGKDVSFMENNAGWHGKAPNDEEFAIAMADLEKVGEALCQK